jgi:hypothetical protein
MRNVLIVITILTMASPVFADDAPSGIIVRRQAPPRSSNFRSIGYARLGYGVAFADTPRTAPAFGFGYRAEVDSIGFDISFANMLVRARPYDSGGSAVAGSIFRLQVLRFVEPAADRSIYVGGGLGWGVVDVGRGPGSSDVSAWDGSGLQAEVTTGYEIRGNTPLRAFVQADLGLPFFRAGGGSSTFERTASGVYRPTVVERRYIPSVVVSVGIGWDPRRP